jgi:AraC-like DNA-binding protein
MAGITDYMDDSPVDRYHRRKPGDGRGKETEIMSDTLAGDGAQRIREGFPGQRSVVLPRSIVASWLDNAPLLDLLPSDVGYYPHAQWHFVERPEGSPQLVLIHCVEGEGWARIDGNVVRVRPGEALVVPPNVPHVYGADPASPWTIYWVHMAGTKAATLIRLLEIDQTSPTLFPGQDPALPALFEKILYILSEGYSADSLMEASTALHQMATHLVTIRHRQPGGADDHDARIKATIDTMSRSLGTTLTIDELARRANLSASHFAFVFRRRTGFPVLDYFVRLKMQKACFLLDTTNLPVKAIAGELGFDDPLYFSRRFRQVHGCSPVQYRAIRKG